MRDLFISQSTSPAPPLNTPPIEKLGAFYAVGHELYEREDYVNAAHAFRYVVFRDPLHRDAWWALGACHEQLDDFETAANLYDLGFRATDLDPDLGLRAARAYLEAGDKNAAQNILGQLSEVELSPKHNDTWSQLQRSTASAA